MIKIKEGAFQIEAISEHGKLTVGLDIEGGVGIVAYVEVLPYRRRLGHATKLYQAAFDHLQAQGMELVSGVARSAPAEAFWQKQSNAGNARLEQVQPARSFRSSARRYRALTRPGS